MPLISSYPNSKMRQHRADLQLWHGRCSQKGRVSWIWVSLDGFHIIGSSTVGYSEYSGYVSSSYSFSGCYLAVESLMRCEPSHTKIYMPALEYEEMRGIHYSILEIFDMLCFRRRVYSLLGLFKSNIMLFNRPKEMRGACVCNLEICCIFCFHSKIL